MLRPELLHLTMSPALRPATLADHAAVERLLQAAALPTVGIATLLAQHAADFVVADDPSAPGDVIAVAGLERCGPRHALLRSVAVHPAWQRHGLARAAVTALVAHAESSGVEALYLLTTTAAHYFPRLGFQPVDRATVPDSIAATEEFTDACPATALAMRRVLGATTGQSA